MRDLLFDYATEMKAPLEKFPVQDLRNHTFNIKTFVQKTHGR